MDERFIELAEAAAAQEVAAKIAESSAQVAPRPSLSHCEDCGEDIPHGRREAMPGVRQCVQCASFDEGEKARRRRH